MHELKFTATDEGNKMNVRCGDRVDVVDEIRLVRLSSRLGLIRARDGKIVVKWGGERFEAEAVALAAVRSSVARRTGAK